MYILLLGSCELTLAVRFSQISLELFLLNCRLIGAVKFHHQFHGLQLLTRLSLNEDDDNSCCTSLTV